MSISCPQCSSDSVQKASVIHEGGTSTSRGVSSGLGGGGGRLAVGVAHSSSQSQTHLAQKFSPPRERVNAGILLIFPILLAVFGGFAVLIGLLAMSAFSSSQIAVILFGAIFLVPGIVLFKFLTRKRGAYPQEMAAYEKLWYCHKCGSAFNA